MPIRILRNAFDFRFELWSADLWSEASVRAHLTNRTVPYPFKDELPHANTLLVAKRMLAKHSEDVGFVISGPEVPGVSFKELYSQLNGCYVTEPKQLKLPADASRKGKLVVCRMESPSGFFPRRHMFRTFAAFSERLIYLHLELFELACIGLENI